MQQPPLSRIRTIAVRSVGSAIALFGLGMACYHILEIIVPGMSAVGPQAWAPPAVVLEVIMTVTGVAAASLALYVLWGARVSAATAIFGVYLSAVAMLTADGSRFGLIERMAGSAEASLAGDYVEGVLFAAVMTTCLLAGLGWTYLFPRPLRREDVGRHVQSAVLKRIQLSQFGGSSQWLAAATMIFSIFGASEVYLDGLPNVQLLIVLVVPILVMLLGTLNLWTSYRAGSAQERQRIYWVLEAGAAGSVLGSLAVGAEVGMHVLNVESGVVTWAHAVFLPLALLALVALLGVAVLYGGAVDPKLVVKTTLRYGVTVLLLTGAFVAIESLASEFLVGQLGLPAGAGGWIAGVIVALLFAPLQERLMHGVERFVSPATHVGGSLGLPSGTQEGLGPNDA